MERKKDVLISGSQLAMILCLCRLPAVLFGLSGSGAEQVLAVPAGEGIRLAIILPLCAAFSRGWELSRRAAAVRLGAALFLLADLAVTLCRMGGLAADTLYPGSPALFFSAAMLAAVLYGAYMGTEAAARAVLPVLVLFAAGVLLTAVGVREELRLIQLRPVESPAAVWKNALRMGLLPGELLIFLAAAPQSGGKAGGAFAAAGGLGLGTVLVASASFLSGTVLGSLQEVSAYPFFRVQTLMKISVFQRMDAWFLALWTAVVYLRCVFLMLAAERMLEPLAEKRKKYLLPVLGAAVMTAAAALQ